MCHAEKGLGVLKNLRGEIHVVFQEVGDLKYWLIVLVDTVRKRKCEASFRVT